MASITDSSPSSGTLVTNSPSTTSRTTPSQFESMGTSACPGSFPAIMGSVPSRAWSASHEFLVPRAKSSPTSTTLGSTSSTPAHTTAKLATVFKTTATIEYMAFSSDTASDTCECLGTTVTANTCEFFHINGEHSSFSKTLASTTKCPRKPDSSTPTTADALFYYWSKSFITHQSNGYCLKPIIPRFIF
ncbi:hypothetical protein E3U43_007762 [Larimichthys crocea]|uniref:Uncharacterized protein n=1 Tax=Larimichthys crocea TaxID=215358 RepID=A0ACD3Q5F2_LARCR|nr:hypothetical protein E3U43_007762 [Larimichthys crocea]